MRKTEIGIGGSTFETIFWEITIRAIWADTRSWRQPQARRKLREIWSCLTKYNYHVNVRLRFMKTENIFFSFYVQSINIEIFYNPLRIKKIQSKKKAIWSSNRHHSKLKQTDDTRRLNKQIEEKNWRQTTLETTNKNKQKAFPWPSQFSHFSFCLQNI
jgi:hypothetical protein